ncbi:hypothetical protein OQA88_3447 [Cercophora sp. LCS_1]
MAYGVYDYTVREMGGYMTTLAGHLDITPKPVLAASDLEVMILANQPNSSQQGQPKFEFRRRVKFTMKRGNIRQLLEKVKDCNDRLDSVIEKADKLQASQSQTGHPRRKPCLSVPLQQIQNHTNQLHQVITNALGCRAHASHQAHLLLEHRMTQKKTKGTRRRGLAKRKEDYPKFTVLFKENERTSQASWRVAEIQVLEEPTSPVFFGSSRPRRSVRIQILPPAQPGGQGLPILSTSGLPEDLKVVQDLCSTFHSVSRSSLGFYLDPVSSDPLSQCVLRGTYPAAQRSICGGHNLVTLEQVLVPPQINNWQPLTEGDRYLLAVTVAASFLQLHGTPWVPERWSQRHIMFCEEILGTNPVNYRRVDVRHPFVTKTYSVHDSSVHTSTALSRANRFNHEGGLNLLALAKILLQIRFGGKIQHYSQNTGRGQVDEFADLQILKRWVHQEKGNLSFAFRGAITHCMKCFADPDADLEDLAFRQSVIDLVVAPLLEELHFLQEGL